MLAKRRTTECDGTRKRENCSVMESWSRVLKLLLVSGLLALAASDVEQVEVELGVDGQVLQDGYTFAEYPDHLPVTEAVEDPAPNEGATVGVDLGESGQVDFQDELDALEEMIRLQEHKLRILAEMRKATGTQLVDNTEEESYRELLERRLDAAVSEVEKSSIEKRFDTYFVERDTRDVIEPVADLKMLRLPGGSGIDLTALAYTNGQIEFFATPLASIYQVENVGGLQSIKSIFLGCNNQHQVRLIVNHDGLQLSVFSLDLSSAPNLIESTQGLFPIKLEVRQLAKMQRDSHITALTYMETFDRILLGFEDGSVEVVSTNGTQLDKLLVGSAAIHGIASHQRRVAFSQGSDLVTTHFLGSGFARNTIRCHGSNALVTSMAYDAQSDDIIYAGTERGHVLAFRVEWNADQQRETCQLLLQSSPHQFKQGGTTTLKAIKGHLCSAGSRELVLFNTSNVNSMSPGSLATLTTLKLSQKHGAASILFDITQGASSSSFAYLSPQVSSQQLRLFHSLLTVPTEQREIPWIIIMYIATAIAVMIGMQFVTRRNIPTNQSSPWDAPNTSSFASYRSQKKHPTYDILRHRFNRKMSNSDFAVGDAFEEPYDYADDLQFDEHQPAYHSLRDQLQERQQRRASKLE